MNLGNLLDIKLQKKPHSVVDVKDGGGGEYDVELVVEHQQDDVQDREEVEPWMYKEWVNTMNDYKEWVQRRGWTLMNVQGMVKRENLRDILRLER